MRYTVRCYHCLPEGVFIADCENLMDAQEIANRHDFIREGDHSAAIEPYSGEPS